MGWTSYRVNRNFSKKEALDTEFTYCNTNVKQTVLKSVVKRGNGGYSVWYGAVERLVQGTLVENGKRYVYALVCLCKVERGEFFYKDMSEDMEPFYYDCPTAILNLLTEPINDHARKWRETCREVALKNNDLAKKLKSASEFTVKAKVEMCYGNITVNVGDVFKITKRKNNWGFMVGIVRCRIRKEDFETDWEFID